MNSGQIRVPSRPLILGVGDAVIGLIFLTGSPDRTSSRAYTVLKTWAPIHVWGLVLLCIGAVLLACAVLHQHLARHRGLLATSIAAGIGATWCAAWASQLLLTAANDTHVSYSGAAVWACLGIVPHLFLAFGSEG